jgi:hypothetical protein
MDRHGDRDILLREVRAAYDVDEECHSLHQLCGQADPVAGAAALGVVGVDVEPRLKVEVESAPFLGQRQIRRQDHIASPDGNRNESPEARLKPFELRK